MTMDNRSAVQSLWRAARDKLARLNHLLAEAELSDEGVFHVLTHDRSRADDPVSSDLASSDLDRRIAEARKARRPG